MIAHMCRVNPCPICSNPDPNFPTYDELRQASTERLIQHHQDRLDEIVAGMRWWQRALYRLLRKVLR